MRNLRFFSGSVIFRLEKSFFKEYFNPLSDTKVDYYTDNKRNYLVHNRLSVLEYIFCNRYRRLRVWFTDRQTNTNANECPTVDTNLWPNQWLLYSKGGLLCSPVQCNTFAYFNGGYWTNPGVTEGVQTKKPFWLCKNSISFHLAPWHSYLSVYW